MRILTILVAATLATFVAFPAAAAKKSAGSGAAPSWELCNEQAHKQGMTRLERGYDGFMSDCQGGRTSVARAAAGASFETCEARALELGMPHGQTGHVEYVRECMGGRPSGRRGL